MQEIIKYSLIVISIQFFYACQIEKKAETNTSDSLSNVLSVNNLDSNFVLENILDLKTFEALESKYGKANLKKDSTLVGPGGITSNATILFPKTENEVILYWDNNEPFKKLMDAIIYCDSTGYKGKWHSKAGLQVGIPMAKVLELNSKPFTISGFGWDYGGYIVSWEGGHFDNKNLTGRFTDFGQVKLSDNEYKSISGDTEFNVNLEPIKKMNPILTELRVFKK